uniref:Uncharacterized protein n=1 Tax=Panagrolaimus sp. PS1159 TaxID=55785 RepID=A0AC35F1F2_9BILA
MSDYIPPRVPESDFPSDVLKWMKANANPKMTLKLMKISKYFECFVVKKLEYEDNSWSLITPDGQQLEGMDVMENITEKIWITDELVILSFTDIPNFIPCIIPKIAVCDIKHLDIYNQKLSFDEFKFFTASGNIEDLKIENTNIILKNGDPIFIDSIFECIPNVKYFYYKEDGLIFAEFFNTVADDKILKLEHLKLNVEPSLPLDYYFSFKKKLWITEKLNLLGDSKIASWLIPKIAVCDTKCLQFNGQSLTFNDFKFLTASGNVENLYLNNTEITYENGDQLFMVDIFKFVQNARLRR